MHLIRYASSCPFYFSPVSTKLKLRFGTVKVGIKLRFGRVYGWYYAEVALCVVPGLLGLLLVHVVS